MDPLIKRLEGEFGVTIICEKFASGPPGHEGKSKVIVKGEDDAMIACCNRIIYDCRASLGHAAVYHLYPFLLD